MSKVQSYIYVAVITLALLAVVVFWSDRQGKVRDMNGEPAESVQSGRYVNKSLGIDFKYPTEWGRLEVDDSLNDKDNQTVHFTSTNKHIAQVALHIPSKTIAFIERDNIENIPEYASERGNKLSKLLADGTIEHVYTIPQKYIDFGNEGEFSIVNFSPSGRYVYVRVVTSIETDVTKLFDLKTNEDLFGKLCMNKELTKLIDCPANNGSHGVYPPGSELTFEELSNHIYWSDDDQVLVIYSFPNGIGSPGLDGLFISDYGNPGKMNIAFTREKGSPPLPPEVLTLGSDKPSQGYLTFLEITNITIDPADTVRFDTTVDRGADESGNRQVIEKRQFEYNSKTRKLNQLSYTPSVN